MRMRTHFLAVSVALALGFGYVALGQIRQPGPARPGLPLQGPLQVRPGAGATRPAAPAQQPASAAAKPGRPAESEDEQAIRASAEAFTRLYNAHDAKAIAALFTPKAEMIDEDGNRVTGAAAIETSFADVFRQYPQGSMAVEVESIRVLSPLLAIEEGKALSKNSPEDPGDWTVYVAIHVKTDAKWKLACVRDWNVPPDELTPHDHLEQELSWLVGQWVDESADSVIETDCQWDASGNFLIQDFRVNVRGEIAMSGTVRIGWNAVAKQFQSWVFDSHGGSSTGMWIHEEDRWLIKMQGATAAGEVGSSTNYYRPVNRDTIAWGSLDRVVAGEPIGDIAEIVVKRRAPAPTQ